jgi:metallopeptidase MepB
MKDTIPEPPSFDISPSQLVQIAKTVSQDMQAATKRLVDTITPQDATFDNAILSLADIDNNLKGKVQFLAFFQSASPSLEIRQGSSAAVSLVDTAYLKLFEDKTLFALVDAVRNKCDENQMTVEDRKYLAKLHSDFLDNGLALSGEAR